LSPEHREYAELLIQKAREEFGAAQTLVATEDYAAHVVGFLLQQAVEKAMKSVLAAREIEIPYTHNLGDLLKRFESAGIAVPPSLASAEWLTPWGVTFRYDDPSEGLDLDKGLKAATAAIALAEGILGEDDSTPGP
jgi:HEPN domain-containing protein